MKCKIVKLNNQIYLTNDEEIKVDDWVLDSIQIPYKIEGSFEKLLKTKIIPDESFN